MKTVYFLILAGAALALAGCGADTYEYHTVHHTYSSGDTPAGAPQHLEAPGAPDTFRAESANQ
jgi:hypothetical protein